MRTVRHEYLNLGLYGSGTPQCKKGKPKDLRLLTLLPLTPSYDIGVSLTQEHATVRPLPEPWLRDFAWGKKQTIKHLLHLFPKELTSFATKHGKVQGLTIQEAGPHYFHWCCIKGKRLCPTSGSWAESRRGPLFLTALA